MKALISTHFELLLLCFIFVFATVMLAVFPMRDEMARWIEGGAVVTVIARSMGVGKSPDPKDPPADASKTTR